MRDFSNKTVFIVFSLIIITSVAFAQTPPLPDITSIYPPGGRRGTTVEVTVAGQNLGGANKFLSSEPDINAQVIAGPQNNDGSFKAKVTIADSARVGVYEFRVATNRGLTNVARFSVGDTSEIEEKEPNNERKSAQRIEPPVTVWGRINPAEDVDWFVFSAKKGQEFIFDVIANRAGSALDADLYLYDASGKLLTWNGDFNGVDPFIAFKFPADGDYYILLRDFNYRGGPNFTYRLTIGALPYVFAVTPSGGQAGSKVKVKFSGVNLGASAESEIDLSSAKARTTRFVSAQTPAGISNALPFAVEDLSEQLKPGAMGNHAMDAAMKVVAPGVVNGQLESSGAADYYAFDAKKGERLMIEVASHRLGSPMDPVLDLYNVQGGAVMLEIDDTPGLGRDARFEFAPPNDGTYVVRVRDRYDSGGERFFYRLKIYTPQPDYELQTSPVRPFIGQGGTLALTVTVQRLNGFNGAIDLEAIGLPKGITPSLPAIAPGQNQAIVTLTAAADAPLDAAFLTIRGKATVAMPNNEKKEIVRDSAGLETIIVNNQPQTRPSSLMAIAVGGPPEFIVSAEPAQLTIVRGKTANLTINVKRRDNFKGQLAVAVLGLTQGVTATTPPIPENQTSATVTLTVPANAAPGTYRIVVTATFAPQQRIFATQPLTLIINEK